LNFAVHDGYSVTLTAVCIDWLVWMENLNI